MLDPHPTLRLRDLGRRTTSLLQSAPIRYAGSGRAALYQLLRQLPRTMAKVVMLPSFHCPSVVDPVLRAGFEVEFYRIRKDLSTDENDLRRRLSSRVAAVLVIHFCGFPSPLAHLLGSRSGADFLVIEDWAHSFLSDLLGPAERPRGEVALYSFSKLVPCLVGGGLHFRKQVVPFEAPPGSVPVWDAAVITKRLLEQIVDNSAPPWLRRTWHYVERKRVYLQERVRRARRPAGGHFRTADSLDERMAVAGMPWMARAVLRAANLEGVYEARRRNYRVLLENLRETGQLTLLRTDLPEGVCPWGFPVMLEERSRLDYRLKNLGVPLFTFGDTLHPLLQERSEHAVRADAELLSRRLMLLSVHQNLSSENMKEIAELVNDFFRSA
jgi:dTDP-4-amino-4,6-dideoxygalactose transaminase